MILHGEVLDIDMPRTTNEISELVPQGSQIKKY